MDTLKKFLEARIAEDEASARAVLATVAPDAWENPTKWGNFFPEDIAFWDLQTPHRAMAECAAKRAIIGEHTAVDYSGLGMESPNACSLCGADRGMHDWEWMRDSFPCGTIRAIAAVYANHPDYQQEWALDG